MFATGARKAGRPAEPSASIGMTVFPLRQAAECRQRKIIEFSRAGIETIQPMSPSPDKNEFAKPGLQRDNEFRECFEFGI
jgi:hypothetical protein